MDRHRRNGTHAFAVAAGLLVSGGLSATLPVTAAATAHAPSPGQAACATPGTWLDPTDFSVLAHDRLLATLSTRPVVLLGERHDNAAHHRWQLHTLAALHGRRPNMIIGFEAFPRRVQPVLDRWVAGDLSAAAFLAEVDWPRVWGFDADLYLPLFHFARDHRIPILALNVDRDLVSKVAAAGFDAVPNEDRENVSTPAPPPPAYRQSLARVFEYKKQHLQPSLDAGLPATHPGDRAATLADPGFQRFVEAQLTWDRAMAQAIAGAKQANPSAMVVGIIGQGHLEHGWGVPHQLADLHIKDTAVLLPVDLPDGCANVSPGLADAVFALPRDMDPKRQRPRLGVMIETADGGARVTEVMPESVAQASGIEAGDVIVGAAGLPVTGSGDLVDTVQRQAPGTWLPLQIRRHGATTERVARFPPQRAAQP